MELSHDDELILSKFFGPSELSALRKKLSGKPLTNAQHQSFFRMRNHYATKAKLLQEIKALELLGRIMDWP